jgi:hypothetical protein
MDALPLCSFVVAVNRHGEDEDQRPTSHEEEEDVHPS